MTTPANADAQKGEFGLQICSLLTISGELELTLEAKPIDTPAHNELVVRIEAPPVNPSDPGLPLGAADLLMAKTIGKGPSRQSTITLPAAGFRAMSGRVGQAMTVAMKAPAS
jgi:NADPH2:quinone reductase